MTHHHILQVVLSMKLTFRILLTTAFLALATNASALSISYGPETVPTQSTNFIDKLLTFNKFDTSLGTLTSIDFSLTGYVEGTARYESLDASSSTVTLNLGASVELQRPDGSQLVLSLPTVIINDSATTFDGLIDFNGGSGGTFNNLNASKNELFSTSSLADLLLFSGPGTIGLTIDGFGASSGSGPGNLITQFATSAGADVTVTYNYNANQVPLPASGLLFGVGLFSLFGIKRKKL